MKCNPVSLQLLSLSLAYIVNSVDKPDILQKVRKPMEFVLKKKKYQGEFCISENKQEILTSTFQNWNKSLVLIWIYTLLGYFSKERLILLY